MVLIYENENVPSEKNLTKYCTVAYTMSARTAVVSTSSKYSNPHVLFGSDLYIYF